MAISGSPKSLIIKPYQTQGNILKDLGKSVYPEYLRNKFRSGITNTGKDPFAAYTKYLLDFETGAVERMGHTLTNMSINTNDGYGLVASNPKFGNYCYRAGSTRAYVISLPAHADLAFTATTQWTIEGYFNYDNVNSMHTVFCNSADSYFRVGYNYTSTNAGKLWATLPASPYTTVSSQNSRTLTNGVWYHFAWCRDGGNIWFYIDGYPIGSAVIPNPSSVAPSYASSIDVGFMSVLDNGAYIRGYADCGRITAAARYPGGLGFTPPTF